MTHTIMASRLRLWLLIAAMAVVVAVSNFLVQFPIGDWLTWAALSYPIAFLVTDITNRGFGATAARFVALWGFAWGVVLSLWLADVRIALASGTAFLCAQMLDIGLFARLQARMPQWWVAPAVSSAVASIVDTWLFFALAFAGTTVPWVQLGVGDLLAKAVMVLVLLLPYRMVVHMWLRPMPV